MKEMVPGGISPELPIWLIVDGHESRLDFDCMVEAATLGIHMILLPGNCTAVLQPLDQW